MSYVDLATVSDEAFDAAIEAMFASDGWTYFSSELYANSLIINDVQSVQDDEDLRYKQGQLAVIGYILNYPEVREFTLGEAEEDEEYDYEGFE